ncbi:MAG TPA: hypothetical protein VJA26_11455, partial [Gammaproteobacteria bacterium]|nr:hypothetical protein [Gammaproteobacteria bacterium]
MSGSAVLISAPELAAYGFPEAHPFGTDRQAAFLAEVTRSECFPRLQVQPPRLATREEIQYFPEPAYVDR